MPAFLSDAQFEKVAQQSTKPIYVIEWYHAGTAEYLSASSTVVYNGISYVGGSIRLDDIAMGETARISAHASTERIKESIDGSWRGGRTCRIYGIPALPGDSGVYALEDGILLLDGVIDSSSTNGKNVTVSVVHKFIAASYTPRLNCSELSARIPPAGTVLTWEGDRYILVQK
jgi:hypothetical protein